MVTGRVPSPPIIRRKPESQTAVEGSNLYLECRVLSDLPFEIKWLKHNKVNGSFFDKKGKPYLAVLKVIYRVTSLSGTDSIDFAFLFHAELE